MAVFCAAAHLAGGWQVSTFYVDPKIITSIIYIFKKIYKNDLFGHFSEVAVRRINYVVLNLVRMISFILPYLFLYKNITPWGT